MSNIKSHWYVITGAPSSGKTTLLAQLAKKGYSVIFEAAREIIDEELKKGNSLETIRNNELLFQKKVLKRKILNERRLSPKELIFFERGIPDSIAYYQMCSVKDDKKLYSAVKSSAYKKIFLLDMLPYKKDYARTENKEQAKRIDKLLLKAYKQHNFTVVRVPVMSIEKRIEFILKESLI